MNGFDDILDARAEHLRGEGLSRRRVRDKRQRWLPILPQVFQFTLSALTASIFEGLKIGVEHVGFPCQR